MVKVSNIQYLSLFQECIIVGVDIVMYGFIEGYHFSSSFAEF